MQTLWQDTRYALRLTAKNPGFAVVAVLTLALGIGANTAIFSAAQAVFLRSLPYGESDRLLYLTSSFPGTARGGDNFSYPDFVDLAAQQRHLDAVAAYQDWMAVALTGIDEPVRLTANFVTGSYFDLLGASAAHGRTFVADEYRVPTGELVVVLSHACWQRQFGGDPAIIGRRIQLNQRSVTVVGVMREGFRDFEETWRPTVDAWLPMGVSQTLLANRLEDRGGRIFNGLARLKPGATIEQAREEIEAISRQLAAAYPPTNEGYRFHLAPLRDHFVGGLYSPLRLLLIGSGLVLLIGCANVAGLLLARMSGRRREMAVRAALGATRGRMIRQLLVECALLAALGGAGGLLLAAWIVPLLQTWSAVKLPGFVEIRLDGFALGTSILLSAATGFVFGLAPAWEGAKTDLREALHQTSHRSSGGRGRLRRTLVAAEVALSVLLLVGAGLMLKSFQKLTSTGIGYRTDSLLTARLDLRTERYARPEARIEFARNLIEKTESIAGVESTILWGPSDLGRGSWVMFVAPEGRAVNGREDLLMASRHSVNPGGLAALGIKLVKGRDLNWHDTPEAPLVAVISESLARQFWPGEEAVGRRLQIEGRDGRPAFIGVVGVAADANHRPRYEANYGANAFRPQLDIYLSYGQRPNQALVVALRTSAASGSVLPAFRRAVLDLDASLPVYNAMTLDERLAEEEGPTRAIATLMAVYAALALLLASLGIYGALQQSVSQRQQEIGIRLALGARPGQVLKLVIGEGMAVFGVGAAFGLAAAFGATRLMANLLFGVSPLDPATFIGIPLLLGLAAFVACYVPARRAARVDPMIALRCE